MESTTTDIVSPAEVRWLKKEKPEYALKKECDLIILEESQSAADAVRSKKTSRMDIAQLATHLPKKKEGIAKFPQKRVESKKGLHTMQKKKPQILWLKNWLETPLINMSALVKLTNYLVRFVELKKQRRIMMIIPNL